MSLSRELKDFVASFQSGLKLWKDADYNAARSEYYRAQTNKVANPSPEDREAAALDLEGKRLQNAERTKRIALMGRSGQGGGGGLSAEAWDSLLPKDAAPSALPDPIAADARAEATQAPEAEELANGGAVGSYGRTVVAAESGGMMEDDNHAQFFREDQERMSAQRDEPAQSAPSSLSEALDGGLKYLQRSFGLQQDNAALPGTDPQRQQRMTAMLSGQGAASDDDVRAVRKSVDPTGEAGDGVGNSAAIERVYDFTKAKSGKEAADRAASELIQWNRQASMKLGALVQEALRNNDIDGAVKGLLAGYSHVPDGNVAERAGDKFVIKNAKTGAVVEEVPLTPQVIQGAAQKLTDGTFYTYMAQTAAGGGSSPTAPVSPGPGTGAAPADAPAAVEGVAPSADASVDPADLPAEGAANSGPAPTPQPPAAQQGAVPAAPAGKYDVPTKPAPMREIDVAKAMKMGASDKDLARIKRFNDQEKSRFRAENMQWQQYQGSRLINDRNHAQAQQRAKDEEARFQRNEALALRREEMKTPEYKSAVETAPLAKIREDNAASGRPGSSFESQDELDRTSAIRTEADYRLAGVGAKYAPKTARADSDPEDRAKPYMEALFGKIDDKQPGKGLQGGILGKLPENARKQVDVTKQRPKPNPEEERILEDIFARAGAVNNQASPKTVASTVYRMAFEMGAQPQIDPRTNRVRLGGDEIYLDEQSMRQLAMIRGQKLRDYQRDEVKASRKASQGYEDVAKRKADAAAAKVASEKAREEFTADPRKAGVLRSQNLYRALRPQNPAQE